MTLRILRAIASVVAATQACCSLTASSTEWRVSPQGSDEPIARAWNQHSLDAAVDDSILPWPGGFWRGDATTMGILGRSNGGIDSPVLL